MADTDSHGHTKIKMRMWLTWHTTDTSRRRHCVAGLNYISEINHDHPGRFVVNW